MGKLWFSQRQKKKIEEKTDKKEEIQNPIPPDLLGNDLDKFGCKNSAGFKWSQLKKECIRPWINAIKLSSMEESSFQATLFFSEDKELAEIFLKEENEGLLMKKQAESSYVYSEYTLVLEKNIWKLYKNQVLIYSS